MTPVPPKAEEAAREIADLYLLSDDEEAALVSDNRFASLAYLRQETCEWIEVIGYPITDGEVGLSIDGELQLENPETVEDDPEGQAITLAWYGYSAYVEATERIAEEILGREIEEDPAIREMFKEVVEQEGDGE